MVDYFLIRKGNIHVPSLYDSTPGSLYWFKSGTNLAGVFAWCVGVSLGLPGLVGAYEPSMVNQSAKNMYKIGWILYAFAAAVVYYVLMQFFLKPEIYPEGHRAEPTSFEHLAHTQREGFFDDEWSSISVTKGVEAHEEASLPPFTKA
jgi:nucleobase:cation symporter-1, NCS1 family